MIKSSFFYTKILIKSALFLISILFIILLTIRLIDTIDVSIFQFTKFSYFTFICFNLFLLISSSSIMYKNLEIMNFLERDILKKQNKILVSGIIIILCSSIFPVLFMFIFKNNLITSEFLLMGIIHFLVIWISSNLLSIVIGITVASLIKNELSIILSLLIYGFILSIPYKISPFNPIFKLLNIFDDNTFIKTNDISGILFNNSYLIDNLFVFLLIMILFLLGKIILTKNNRFSLIALNILLMSSLIFIVIQSNNNNKIFYSEYPQIENNSYKIISYNMDLKLSNKLTNYVELETVYKDQTKKIRLLLDNIFRVENITIDGKSVNFKHENNILEIDTNHNKEAKNIIGIKYEGTVNLQNDLGFDLFYVTPNAINLPDNIFTWYPKLPSLDKDKFKYNINVITSSPIYSNLTSIKSENKYILSGFSSELHIFAGQYQTFEENGVNYIFPISYKLDSFKSQLNNAIKEEITYNAEYELSPEELKTLKNKTYKTVIVGVWPLTTPNDSLYIDGDTLLLRYIDY